METEEVLSCADGFARAVIEGRLDPIAGYITADFLATISQLVEILETLPRPIEKAEIESIHPVPHRRSDDKPEGEEFVTVTAFLCQGEEVFLRAVWTVELPHPLMRSAKIVQRRGRVSG